MTNEQTDEAVARILITDALVTCGKTIKQIGATGALREIYDQVNQLIEMAKAGECPAFYNAHIYHGPPTSLDAPNCPYVHEECNEWGPPFGQAQEENLCK